jgi:hypothetical protein
MTGVTRLSTHEQWKRDIRTYQPEPLHPAIFRDGQSMGDPLERRACLQGRVGMTVEGIGYSTPDWDIMYNPTSRRQKLTPSRYRAEQEYWFTERVDPVANHPVFAQLEAGYKRFCSKGNRCKHPEGPILAAEESCFYTNKSRISPSNPYGFEDECRECHKARARVTYQHKKWRNNKPSVKTEQRAA